MQPGAMFAKIRAHALVIDTLEAAQRDLEMRYEDTTTDPGVLSKACEVIDAQVVEMAREMAEVFAALEDIGAADLIGLAAYAAAQVEIVPEGAA